MEFDLEKFISQYSTNEDQLATAMITNSIQPTAMMSNPIQPTPYQNAGIQQQYSTVNSVPTTTVIQTDQLNQDSTLQKILTEMQLLNSRQDTVMNKILGELQTFNTQLLELQTLNRNVQQLNTNVEMLREHRSLELNVTSKPVKIPVKFDFDKTFFHDLVDSFTTVVKKTSATTSCQSNTSKRNSTSTQTSTSTKRKATDCTKEQNKKQNTDSHYQKPTVSGLGTHVKSIDNFKIPPIHIKKRKT